MNHTKSIRAPTPTSNWKLILPDTDEYPLSLLEEYRKEAVYSCSDPRLHIRERENVERLTNEAEKRLKDDFETLERVITDYVEYNGRIPHIV